MCGKEVGDLLVARKISLDNFCRGGPETYRSESFRKKESRDEVPCLEEKT